jgi:hypothetical protein
MTNFISRIIVFFNQKKTQWFIAFLIFIILFFIGYQHATKGIDFWDDGFYTATSMRYVFGDIPFVDEFATHIYSFDKLVAPVFFLFPKINLLQLRLVGITFNLFTIFMLFILLSRYAPPIFSSITCALIFLINNFSFLASPSYNSLGSNFITLSFVSLIYSSISNKWRYTLAILSGLLLVFASISYLSLSGMILAPLIFIVLSLIYTKQFAIIRKNIITLIGTYFFCFIFIASLMYLGGILPVFIKGFIDQSSKRDIGGGLLFKKLSDIYFWFINSIKNGFVMSVVFFSSIFMIGEIAGFKNKSTNRLDIFISCGLILYFIPKMVESDPSTLPFSLYAIFAGFFVILINKYLLKSSTKLKYLIITWVMFVALIFQATTNINPFQLLINIIPLIAYMFVLLHINVLTASILVAVFLYCYFWKAASILGLLYLSSSFLIGSSIIAFFHNKLFSDKEKETYEWNLICKIATIWFILAGLLFSFSSFSGYARMIQGVAPLFGIIFIFIYRVINGYSIRYKVKMSPIIWKSILYLIISIFLVLGFNYYTRYFNNEVSSELTTKFSYPTLKGIYSTPRKVEIIEDLMKYLKGKVKFGDYFLTYYYDPLLYFITRTRPSYREVLAQEDYTPFSVRKQMVKDIVIRKKVPQYVVKFMVHEGHVFKDPVHFICEDNQQCPLDKFVTDNYYVDKVLYPFEVWRYGNGSKLKKWENSIPIFSETLINLPDSDISSDTFLQNTKPLIIFTSTDNIAISKTTNEKFSYITIKPINEAQSFRFGYLFTDKSKPGLNLKQNDTLIFTLTAEISEKKKEYNAIRGFMSITEENNKGIIEKNDIALSISRWNDYIISKKVRDPHNTFTFVIEWLPGSKSDWINIKNIRIFTEKSISPSINIEDATKIMDP